jgi:hypothetical protein
MFLTNYTPPAVPSLEHQLQLQHDPFVAKAVLFLNKISAWHEVLYPAFR